MFSGLHIKIISEVDKKLKRIALVFSDFWTETGAHVKKREETCLLIQNCLEFFSTFSLPHYLLFACTSPRMLSFHHSSWFHTLRPNIKVDRSRNKKHGMAFHRRLCPLQLFVSCYLPLLSINLYLSGLPICLPAFFPSHWKIAMLLITAVFVFCQAPTW